MHRWSLICLVLVGSHAFAAGDAALSAFSQWAARPGAARDLERGVAFAKARRAELLTLMQTEPERARRWCWNGGALPALINAQMEQRLETQGDFEVLARLGDQTRSSVSYFVKTPQGRFQIARTKDAKLRKSVREVTVVGCALEQWAAVDGEAMDRSWPPPGEVAASGWTVGNKKLLFIRVDFSDAPTAPLSEAAAQTVLTSFNNYLRAASYNKTSLNVTVIPTVLRMPKSKAQYANANDDTGLLSDARTAAANAGYNRSGYDLDLVAFSKVSAWGYSGQGYIGQAGVWLNGSFTLETIAHEVGHNLGLYHANFWESVGETIIGGGSSLEYGNPFDIMGNSGAGHYNAWYKDSLDWFAPQEVQVVNASGNFRVHDLEQSSLGALHALRIPLSAARSYWLEYRPQAQGLAARGALINWGYPSDDSSNLLDFTPWTEDAEDSPLLVGQTFSDNTAGIHITPTGVVTTMPPALDVVVNRGLFPGNHAPTVTLTPSATTAGIGATVMFTATAADIDNEPLAYFWDFGDGSASSNQAAASHAWNNDRDALVRVVVTDMKGGVASASTLVKIGMPSTVRISGRVLEGTNPVEGARVYAANRSTFTDSQGNYTLTRLNPGNQTVRAIKPGWTIAASFPNPVNATASVSGKDFNASRGLYSISGKVMSVGQGVAGISVAAGPYSAVTDGSGNYLLSGIPAGAYNLAVVAVAGQTFVTDGFTNPVQVTNVSLSNRNFKELVVPITGEVLGGPGGPHTVSDGVRTAMTALSNGHWLYTLPKVPPGKVNLVAYASGQIITPDFMNPVSVGNSALTGLNFNAVAGVASFVRGRVDEAGFPLADVVVTDGTRQSTTDSDGRFVLVGVPDGSYTVTPVLPGYQFAPTTQNVMVAGADVMNVDFTVLNPNVAPTIVVRPHALPSPVTGTTATLAVLGDDPIEGEAALTYTWSLTQGSGMVNFSKNASNAAKSTGVTFDAAGAHVFQVVVSDQLGLKATAEVTATVVATPTMLSIAPLTTTVEVDADKQFVITVKDQFGEEMDVADGVTWSATGGGPISMSGKYTPASVGNFEVKAEVAGLTATAQVQVIAGPVPRITQAPRCDPSPVTGERCVLSVKATDDEGEENLTYTWSAVSPPAAVRFGVNGSNEAKTSEATFTALGSYTMRVDVTDDRGLSATGFMTLEVVSGLARVTVSGGEMPVAPGGHVTFTAVGHNLAGVSVSLPACEWSASAGSIDGNGAFTAPAEEGTVTVTLRCAEVTGSQELTVSKTLAKSGCGCDAGAMGALSWLGLLLVPAFRRRQRELRTKAGSSTARFSTQRFSAAWLSVLLLGTLTGAGCTRPALEPDLRSAAPGGEELVSRASHQALGETVGGYPSDQERMMHVLLNLARHSATTPNANECGDWTSEVGADVRKNPLVYSREANIGARYTSRHMSELGCYQHESCCVLGDAGMGLVSCVAAGECTGMGCNKACDAGTAQTPAARFALFGFDTYSGESVSQGIASAYDTWCQWMLSQGNREGIYEDAGTQVGVGLFNAKNQTCNGSYWALAYGRGPVTIPRIPAASAMHNPPNPINAAQVYFAANYFDSSGKAPQRSVVVVGGHCFDLERKWGHDDNGTYEARFTDPDLLPDGCHSYYFLFQDGQGARHVYPESGSFQLALGDGQTCPLAFDPSMPKAADCETGMDTCPAGAQQSCFTADNQLLRFGECRQGYQVCKNGFWTACKDMIGPFPEACDGLDNDCNGQVDEGNPGGNASCEVPGERGICKAGTRACTSGRLTCYSTQMPQVEICDGLDNDCDGVIDDGFGLLTCGQGECFRTVAGCAPGGVAGTCVPGVPQAEIPNDFKDNDCNGLVDDGVDCRFPDAGGLGRLRTCYSASLLTADGGMQQLRLPCKTGSQFCQMDAGWGTCLGEVVPAAEICDGVDNDCDTVIDNNEQLGWLRCGKGGCTAYAQSCRNGAPNTCAAASVGAEVCNGLDDNCDGTVDEGCDCRTDDERPCYTGPSTTRDVGVCRAGKRLCPDGGYSKCQLQVIPTQELCNQLDDDCDGVVDNACLAVDGGTTVDGGRETQADGGVSVGPPKGCGCNASGAEGLFAALALGLFGWRRRSRSSV